MKKSLFIILILFCMFFIGCKINKPIEVSKNIIDIEFTNEVYEYDIDEFDINDITFNIIYSDETKEIKSLESSMISEENLSKLSEHGTHEIMVSYNEISKKITINLIKKYKVIFKLDDEILHEEKVEFGKSANPPKVEEAPGFHFTGWDKEFNNITSDLVVNALYTIDEFTVTFTDIDGEVIKTEIVKYGNEAVAPDMIDVGYYKFTGWDKEFNNITEDTTIKSVYKKNTLEFDEELKAKCIEDFKFLHYKLETDNPELLCVYGDIYVVCFERSRGYIYNGYQIYAVPDESYKDLERSYFVYYKQYDRRIFVWSPVDGLLSLNDLTIEQVKGIPWPQLDEMPEDPNNIGTISQGILDQIEETLLSLPSYSNRYYNGISFRGTYDNVIVVAANFSDGFDLVGDTYETIEDREIIYMRSSDCLFAYKDGVVYTLTEAYENGIISYEAICKIPYWYRNVNE